jgi:hypothetical protein
MTKQALSDIGASLLYGIIVLIAYLWAKQIFKETDANNRKNF